MRNIVNQFFKSLKYVFAVAIILSLSLISSVAYAQDPENFTDATVPEILMNAANWAIGVAAFLAILVIIIAGFLWIISGGDADKIGVARSAITSAVIGLVIALGSWAIVRVVMVSFFKIGV